MKPVDVNIKPGRRLRICHIVLQLRVGGMEQLLLEFARRADRARFDLCFVSLESRGSLADDIEACGWPVLALEEPPGLRAGLVPRLSRLFRRLRLDVVHTHNTKPLLYGAPAAWLAGVPGVVHTRHGQSYKATPRKLTLFRLATCLVNQVVCVSRDCAQLSAADGVSPAKLSTIWNGIDTTRFSYRGPQPHGPAVFVGRLSPEKDVATLLRAAALVVQEEPAFQLVLAGDGACMPALCDLARKLGITEQVHFLGEVRGIPQLLAEASLFVLPSLSEGVPLTILESMAAGLPVVATRVGGIPEIVVDGQTGLLVPAAAPEALARALLSVWRDPEGGRRMGLVGRDRILECFDTRHMVAQYEALYETVRGRTVSLSRLAKHPVRQLVPVAAQTL
jgi:sugar transferase (PEP-CTERM/EpsH1 system associated)